MLYLLNTPGGYYFRMRVPKDLREKSGKREIKKPLHTSSRLHAQRMSVTLIAQCHEYFRQLRGSTVSKPLFSSIEFSAPEIRPDGTLKFGSLKTDPLQLEAEKEMFRFIVQAMQIQSAKNQSTLETNEASPSTPTLQVPPLAPTIAIPESVAVTPTHSTSKSATVSSSSMLFSEAIEKYVKEKFILSPDVTVAYKKNVSNDLSVFVELIGDIPINLIDRDTAVDAYVKLQKLPSQFKRSFPDMTIDELVASDIPARSGRTVNAAMANISGLFEWLVLQKLVNADYFTKLRSSSTSAGRSRYNDDELILIFSHPVFTDHEFNFPYHYFCPIVSLLSGARLNELCQLRLSDITEENGITILNITDDEETKTKTKAGIRRVPVHPFLLKLGFGEYIKSRKGHHMLFDGLRLEPETGRWSANASAWYGRFRKSIDLRQRGKDFHSFRHNVISMLIDKEVDERLIKAVVGHAEGLSKEVLKTDVTFDVYGKMRFNANTLHRTICELNFDDILENVVPWHPGIVPIKHIANFAERGKAAHAPAAALRKKIADGKINLVQATD
jgi:integrase